MFKKLLLLLTLPAAVFAKPTVHLNELHLLVKTRAYPIGFNLESPSLVEETGWQTTEPWSIYPAGGWHGLEVWAYRDYVNGSSDIWMNGTFRVHAPRKKNTNVAKWAARQQSIILNHYNKDKAYATVSGGSLATAPDALNFAFMGTLIIGQKKCKNVIIAQGNTATINNWWIYSNFWPMDKNGKPEKEGYRNRILCGSGYNGDHSPKQFIVKRGSVSNRFYLEEE